MKSILLALLIAASLYSSAEARTVKYPTCEPSLPYSCSVVRWASRNFSRSYLESEGKKRGLTACMKRQAQACIAGAP